jgi:hypothetical protein
VTLPLARWKGQCLSLSRRRMSCPDLAPCRGRSSRPGRLSRLHRAGPSAALDKVFSCGAKCSGTAAWAQRHRYGGWAAPLPQMGRASAADGPRPGRKGAPAEDEPGPGPVSASLSPPLNTPGPVSASLSAPLEDPRPGLPNSRARSLVHPAARSLFDSPAAVSRIPSAASPTLRLRFPNTIGRRLVDALVAVSEHPRPRPPQPPPAALRPPLAAASATPWPLPIAPSSCSCLFSGAPATHRPPPMAPLAAASSPLGRHQCQMLIW